jgi:hypothetical protein
MGSLSWYRAARRVVGLEPLQELPNLEALFEAEEGQPAGDYKVLKWVIPSILVVAGCAAFVVGLIQYRPLCFIAPVIWATAAVAWAVCDRLDKAIRPSKARIRQHSEAIWGRYRGISNMVGIEPAVSAPVAAILDEAAGIYLKHWPVANPPRFLSEDAYGRGLIAIEEAMARLLELAIPPTARAQELELSAGWAEPLLKEMRAMDEALDRHRQAGLALRPDGSPDPIAGLRHARQELQGLESAYDELEERQSTR